MKKVIFLISIFIISLTACGKAEVTTIPEEVPEIQEEITDTEKKINVVLEESEPIVVSVQEEIAKEDIPDEAETPKTVTEEAVTSTEPVLDEEQEETLFEDAAEESIFEDDSEDSIFATEEINYGSQYELFLRNQLPYNYYEFLSFQLFNSNGKGYDYGYVSDAFTYYVAYMHFGQTAEASILDADTDENDILLNMQYNAQPYEMRKDLTSYIASQFGVYVYDSEEETILKTHERIHAMLIYDDDYLFSSMGQCLNDGRGVCWTYSQIARTLLNLEGIPAYVVTGTYQGEGHAFLKAYFNGSWQFLDFTYGGTPFIQDMGKYSVIQDINT